MNIYLRFALLTLTSICSAAITAQTFQVTYQANHTTGDKMYKNGKNTLYFTIDTAIYVHDDHPAESGVSVEGTTVMSVVGDPTGAPILTIRSEGTQYVRNSYYNRGRFHVLIDSVPAIDWKLSDDEGSEPSGKNRKATGWFAGREYEVWYNPDIPFPYGPHRFGGLPGLIVKVKSTDGYVDFQMTDFAPLAEEDRPEKLFHVEGEQLTLAEFEEAVIKLYLKVESTVTGGGPHPMAGGWPTNWTVEKKLFTIIERFRKERGY